MDEQKITAPSKNAAIIHDLSAPRGQGKTDLLIHLAKGYAAAGRRVLFLVPSESMAKTVDRAYGLGAWDGLFVHGGNNLYRSPILHNMWDAVLIDDAELFDSREGEIVELVEKALSGNPRPIPVLVMRTAPRAAIAKARGQA